MTAETLGSQLRMTVNYSLNMMLHAIVVISFVVVSAATLRVDYTSFEEKEHGKAYPSRTIIDKDGQFIRLIGKIISKPCEGLNW